MTDASPTAERWDNSSLMSHFHWLIDHQHNVTVLVDAKAGLVFAVQGALLAGTCQTLGQIVEALASLRLWIGVPLVIYGVLALISLWQAFDAIRPRTSAKAVATPAKNTPISFYGDIAKARSGEELIHQINDDPEDRRVESLAHSAVHMSHIVVRKLDRTRQSMTVMIVSVIFWLFTIALVAGENY